MVPVFFPHQDVSSFSSFMLHRVGLLTVILLGGRVSAGSVSLFPCLLRCFDKKPGRSTTETFQPSHRISCSCVPHFYRLLAGFLCSVFQTKNPVFLTLSPAASAEWSPRELSLYRLLNADFREQDRTGLEKWRFYLHYLFGSIRKLPCLSAQQDLYRCLCVCVCGRFECFSLCGGR